MCRDSCKQEDDTLREQKMKKILIVNNNMRVGGVQKSLYNLLWTLEREHRYDITLLLFCMNGAYMEHLPQSVKVITCGGVFRYMGESQGYFRNNIKDTLARGFLALISKWLGREAAVRLMLLTQPVLEEPYDCAISYLHNGRRKSFYGGVQDYVLHCVKARKKVAFLHCDYSQCGANHADNNRMLAQFDQIAACSDGCRRVFETVLSDLAERCITVRNCHRFEEIIERANETPLVYDDTYTNIVVVARLGPEKGIDRAVRGAAVALEKGLRIRLHIVGGGSMQESLTSLVRELGIDQSVRFYGEQTNPYRFMKNADLLLLSSYHEAAPMVIDEARCLGLPVLTTETTSSREMVLEDGCGWVCANTQEALTEALCRVSADREALVAMKNKLQNEPVSNDKAIAQFNLLVSDGIER